MRVDFIYEDNSIITKNIAYYSKYKLIKSKILLRDLFNFANSIRDTKCVKIYVRCKND